MALLRIKSDLGYDLNSECQVVDMEGHPTLVLESWGPSERNPDYNEALETILRRLKKAGVASIWAYLASRPVLAALSDADRSLTVDGHSEIQIADKEPEALRKELGKAQLLIGRAPGASGGNRTKRIQIRQPAMTGKDWLGIIEGNFVKVSAGQDGFEVEVDLTRYEATVEKLRTLVLNKQPPVGVISPRQKLGQAIVFTRSPAVKVWVLHQAEGNCEWCKGYTFKDLFGRWYLEVHHLLSLAEGGSDTPANTVALCPNCHRAFHYSAEKLALKKRLIAELPRLQEERPFQYPESPQANRIIAKD